MKTTSNKAYFTFHAPQKIVNKILSLKTYFMNLKMQFKLIIIFLVFTIVPFSILGILTFSKSSKVIMQEASDNSSQIVRQVSDKLDYNMKEMDKNMLLFVWNSQTQDILKSNYSTETLHMRKSNQMELESAMQTFLNTRNEIESVYIYRNDGDEFYIDDSTYNREVRQRIVMKRAQITADAEKYNGKNDWITLNLDKGLITGARIIYDTINLNKLGLLVINIQDKYFGDLYNNIKMSPNSFFVIRNENGEIISTNSVLRTEELQSIVNNEQKVKAGQNFFQVNQYFVARSRCEFANWEVLGIIPRSELLGGVSNIGSSILFIGIVCAAVSIALLVILSAYIIKPIRKLIKLMKKVEQEDFSVKAELISTDEIGELTVVFNKMIEKIRYMIEEVYKDQIIKKEAEFKLLQAQINPHFLYNTLDSINWIAKINGVEDISRMVVALGQLMRISIAKGKGVVTLEQEMEYINNYLIIQGMRYKDKFKVITEIDESTKKCIVPKMLLQPIVENALVHGIEKKIGKGVVSIRIIKHSDILIIHIMDDGPGIEEAICRSILRNEETDSSQPYNPAHTGIGISNVNQRIKMMFGPEYGISIESGEGKGTDVKVVLPVKLQELEVAND